MSDISEHASPSVVLHMIERVDRTLSFVDRAQAQAAVSAAPSDHGMLFVPYGSDDDVSASISRIL